MSVVKVMTRTIPVGAPGLPLVETRVSDLYGWIRRAAETDGNRRAVRRGRRRGVSPGVRGRSGRARGGHARTRARRSARPGRAQAGISPGARAAPAERAGAPGTWRDDPANERRNTSSAGVRGRP